jgi:hypothetical protein
VSSRTQRLSILVGLALVTALVVVIAVRALGGTETATKAEYQETIVTTRDRIDYAYARIGKSTSVEQLADRLEEASAVVGTSADDLDGAPVAAGFEELNGKLVDTLGRFSVSLANTADQIRDPAFAETLPTINSIGFPEWDEANAILSEMARKGLKVELLQRH